MAFALKLFIQVLAALRVSLSRIFVHLYFPQVSCPSGAGHPWGNCPIIFLSYEGHHILPTIWCPTSDQSILASGDLLNKGIMVKHRAYKASCFSLFLPPDPWKPIVYSKQPWFTKFTFEPLSPVVWSIVGFIRVCPRSTRSQPSSEWGIFKARMAITRDISIIDQPSYPDSI